ncbi:MAG: TldD/PmbA family protein [Acholeplasmatales bacterium]|nr:TldD/PmbA family protein [Acholeplasmatales bacterium]
MDYNKLIDSLKKANASDVEIYNVSEIGDNLTLFDSVPTENISYSTNVFNINCNINQKNVSMYVENLNDSNIDNIVKRLIDEANILDVKENHMFYDDSKVVLIYDNEVNDLFKYPKSRIIDNLQALTKKIKGVSTFCKNVRISLGIVKEKEVIQNTKGLNKTHIQDLGYLSVEAVVKKGNISVPGNYMTYFNNFDEIKEEEIINKTVVEALKNINATSIKTGIYDTVLDKDCMITLLRAFSSHFSGEELVKKKTQFVNKVDKSIANDIVSIIDDPKKNKYHLIPFDDEGVDTYSKYVVENGILKTFLHNLDTSSKLGLKSTGNGFKEGKVKGNTNISPTNLYFKEGTKNLDELFGRVKNGVYINSFAGAHAGINKTSGDFNLQSKGYLIEDGKLACPITLVITSGNYFDLLNSIEEFANDLDFNGSYGSPSAYVGKLKISGNK